MRIIKLHSRCFNSSNVIHHLPRSSVICVSASPDSGGADLLLTSGGLLQVKETVEEVLAMLGWEE